MKIFTYHNPDTRVLQLFNATQMLQYAIKSGKIERFEVPLSASWIDYCRKYRGIEQPRLDRLREPYLSIPAVFVALPDGTHLAVDGHHRMVKRFELGYDSIEGYVFTLIQAQRFLVIF